MNIKKVLIDTEYLLFGIDIAFITNSKITEHSELLKYRDFLRMATDAIMSKKTMKDCINKYSEMEDVLTVLNILFENTAIEKNKNAYDYILENGLFSKIKISIELIRKEKRVLSSDYIKQYQKIIFITNYSIFLINAISTLMSYAFNFSINNCSSIIDNDKIHRTIDVFIEVILDERNERRFI